MRVPATLSLGFSVGPGSNYLDRIVWQEADRAAVKDWITADIADTIPEFYRLKWGALSLEVDADGHLAEDQVREYIAARLDELNNDATAPFFVTLTQPAGGGQPQPSTVTYYWVGGVRYCAHEYEVSWRMNAGDPPQPWQSQEFDPGGAPFQADMVLTLTWPTVLPDAGA